MNSHRWLMGTWNVRLLIVDEEANTLASLAHTFPLAGYEATVCNSDARALELVKSKQFDLIFSDVVMLMPEKGFHFWKI